LFPVILILSGIKKNLKLGQIFFLSESYMTLLYLLIIVLPKFDPLTATGMALFVNLGPTCQNLFPLVSGSAESTLA
jgi:hypothetical protein